MDVSPSKAGLYGFRDPSRPRLRNRRRHFYLRGSQDRRAEMERRTLRQRPGVAAGKLRLAPGLGRRRAGRASAGGPGRARRSSLLCGPGGKDLESSGGCRRPALRSERSGGGLLQVAAGRSENDCRAVVNKRSSVAIRARIRILHGEDIAIGPGKAELLEFVRETGSIAEAAK